MAPGKSSQAFCGLGIPFSLKNDWGPQRAFVLRGLNLPIFTLLEIKTGILFYLLLFFISYLYIKTGISNILVLNFYFKF